MLEKLEHDFAKRDEKARNHLGLVVGEELLIEDGRDVGVDMLMSD